jgi:hypothetical protein
MKNVLTSFLTTLGNTNNEKQIRFSLWLTASYLMVAIVAIVHHEMWRDEYQTWLVVSQSHSILDLWNNSQYEGHALLWHFLLFIITQFTQNPLSMQLVHMALAASAILIMAVSSPFTRLQKILLTFGYFLLYEYAVISRYYVLTVLLLFIALSLFHNSQRKPILFSIVLFLLANTSIFGVIFSVLLMVLIVHQFITGQQGDKSLIAGNWRPLVAIGIFISGVSFSLYSILRGAHTAFAQTSFLWQGGLDSKRLVLTISKILAALVPIPNTLQVDFWNKSLVFDIPWEMRVIITICIIGFFFWSFQKNRSVLFFWGSGVLIIGMLVYRLLIPAIRYEGHIFLLLVSSQWLNNLLSSRPGIPRLKKAKRTLQPYKSFFFQSILLLQVIAGCIAYYLEIRYPFSNCDKAGQYLAREGISRQCLYGSLDFIVSPLTAFVHRPIYYPERDSVGTYIISDDKRKQFPQMQEVVEKATNLIHTTCDSMLLILSDSMTYAQNNRILEVVDQQLPGDVHIKLLQKFNTPCIAWDETYYIYQLSRVHLKE